MIEMIPHQQIRFDALLTRGFSAHPQPGQSWEEALTEAEARAPMTREQAERAHTEAKARFDAAMARVKAAIAESKAAHIEYRDANDAVQDAYTILKPFLVQQ